MTTGTDEIWRPSGCSPETAVRRRETEVWKIGIACIVVTTAAVQAVDLISG